MTALFLASVALPAIGQAINIDVARRGSLNVLPSTAYGGAAGQPGVWNPINVDGSLVDTGGGAVGAGIGLVGLSFGASAIPGASADEMALMEDVAGGVGLSGDERSSVVVAGLLAGKYTMYFYGYGNHIASPGGGKYRVWNSNLGYILDTTLTAAPSWPGGQVEGQTYFKFDFTITSASQYIQVILVGRGGDSFPISTYCNGLQIVPVPSAGAATLLGMAGLSGLRRRR